MFDDCFPCDGSLPLLCDALDFSLHCPYLSLDSLLDCFCVATVVRSLFEDCLSGRKTWDGRGSISLLLVQLAQPGLAGPCQSQATWKRTSGEIKMSQKINILLLMNCQDSLHMLEEYKGRNSKTVRSNWICWQRFCFFPKSRMNSKYGWNL